MGAVPVTDLYFAYGSNLLDSEIRRHAPDAESVGVAFLVGYRLVFNKHSVSRGGDAASMEESPSSVVWGYLYRLGDRDRAGLTRREKGYERKAVAVQRVLGRRSRTVSTPAFTFVGQSVCPERCGPSASYLALVIKGARSRKLPQKHVEAIAAEGRRLPAQRK
jgi:hypothetical protein